MTVTRDIREAEVEGRAMFIEATVTATASGRPRVAHAERRQPHLPLDACGAPDYTPPTVAR